MKIRLLIAIFYFAFANQLAIAQKTVISGKVYDATTKETLPFVNIAFSNSKIGNTSNINGDYSIETYYATDTLIASFVGYKAQKIPIKKDEVQVIDFYLESGEFNLQEVVIDYKGNPADLILERVIENKAANNKEKLTAYEYDVYNKVEFDLNNVDKGLKDRRYMKSFKFIFDYMDSTAEKPYLPMFMTESISRFSYRKSPKARKEVILASKVSGLPQNNISQFLGDMYQNVNIYENYIDLFERNFVSPISNFGQRFYKYYLTDSAFIDQNWCYRLDFKPRRIQEMVFVGHFWVHDTTYAIKRIDMSFAEDANINYVRQIQLVQDYTQVDHETWMLSRDYILADINLSNKEMGIYGRKTTTYKNFVINQPRDDAFFSGVENVIVDALASDRSDSYWTENRHIPLAENEAELYQMVDSIKKVPAFNNLVDLVKLLFSGYKKVGPLEFGKYYKIYSYNPIEGHRFRLGARTSSELSENFRLEGHVAYGTNDQRYKYGISGDFLLSEQPRQILTLGYKNDLEQLGQSRNAFSEDNILSSFLRRTPRDKLTNVEGYNLAFEREWFRGFSTTFLANLREMTALGALNYLTYSESGSAVYIIDQGFIKDFNVGLYTRLAYRENFIFSGLDRYSIGTDFPTFEALYQRGISGVDNSAYDYDIVKLAVKDNVKFGIWGNLDWRLEGGKYFGALPYPLLELHPGNESWFYDNSAYNLMNFFEFASDEYLSLFATYHLEGLFFNKVPLLRKLKWREVLTVRSAWGRLDGAKHSQALLLPENMYSLESRPYIEGSVGIENILKIFRVDFLQRFTHLDHPNIATFGIRVMVELRF
ncbi:MAG: DUF5686 family protein [Vicingaceae bacterium]